MTGHLVRLEVNLPGELDNSRRVRRRELSETSVPDTVIGVLKLGMVESVEGLQSKLQPASLSEGKGFEEREVPVIAARSSQRVVAEIAPDAGYRSRKD